MFAIPSAVGTIPASIYAQSAAPADVKNNREALTSLIGDTTGTVSVETKARALTALDRLAFGSAGEQAKPASDTVVLSDEAVRWLSLSQIASEGGAR